MLVNPARGFLPAFAGTFNNFSMLGKERIFVFLFLVEHLHNLCF